ncbi:MAG: hypothetical protein V7631_2484 [Massilia sp.]|jgi:Flp pilus assembly protein TadG
MLNKGKHIEKRSRGVHVRLTRGAPQLRRQRGAFAVMTAALILVMLGFCGLAIDLGRVYNRKVELQGVADAAALAAAAELDGTAEGIDRAMNAAADSAGRNYRYNYAASSIEWSNAAVRFSSVPSNGTWLEAGEARTQAQALFNVEVDTSRLAEHHGRVDTALIRVLSAANASVHMRGRAVAARTTINVTPLAICAMSNLRGAARGEELVEHGFRRGISYNLMKLNPNNKNKGANFLVNPVAPPGTAGKSLKSRLDVIRPFVCTGTMAMPRVTGGNITVEDDFPFQSVFPQLNSRFGSYTSPCTPAGAPPDSNVKEFTVSSTENAITWVTDKPAGQSAAKATTDTSLLTVADLPSDSGTTITAPMYGPLWIASRAARYSSYEEGKPEPAPGGYATFNATSTHWAKLYTPGLPKPKGTYPSPVPAKSGSHTISPTGLTGVADRRILNIPLLRCPVSPGSPAQAEVLAIARFYMTRQASGDDLVAEFTGLARPDALRGQVELHQ